MKGIPSSIAWALALACSAAAAQSAPPDSLEKWMNTIAQQELLQRAQAIRGIHTVDYLTIKAR
jgi:hypothetical protein